MRYLVLLFVATFTVSCSMGQKPTKEIITAALKKVWEKPATTMEPKSTVTVNDIKIGTSDKSNYAQQLDGVPKGVTVTTVKIDFVQNLFNSDKTQKVRRIMTALAYKDQFNEWALMDIATTYPGQ
jgi:hypothetical protein